MGRIWSDENRFRTWLAVEVAATETLAEAGIVPNAIAAPHRSDSPRARPIGRCHGKRERAHGLRGRAAPVPPPVQLEVISENQRRRD